MKELDGKCPRGIPGKDGLDFAKVKTKLFTASMNGFGSIQTSLLSEKCNEFLETLDYRDVISVTPSFALSKSSGAFVITVVYRTWGE